MLSNQEYLQLEKIRAQFKNLEKSLFEIKKKLVQKEGFWLISWHTYEQEKLINDPAFARIEAFIGVISSNVESWLEHNSITPDFMQNYNVMRNSFEKQVELLQVEIIYREPTSWEKISSGFKAFFKFVINKLPRIIINYLTGGKSILLLDK